MKKTLVVLAAAYGMILSYLVGYMDGYAGHLVDSREEPETLFTGSDDMEDMHAVPLRNEDGSVTLLLAVVVFAVILVTCSVLGIGGVR